MDIVNEDLRFENTLVPTEKLKINASLVEHNGRYFCAYRSDHIHNYDPRNYLTELNIYFKPISHVRMLSENGNTAFEDIRLFSDGKNLLAIYTAFEKISNSRWNNKYNIEICLVDIQTGRLFKQKSLKDFSLRHHNKNWVPYIAGDRIYIITDFDPAFRIIKSNKNFDISTFREFFHEYAVPCWDFGEIRGGTPFLPSNIDNWQYSFVHSSLTVPNGDDISRFYFYTVARFNHETKQIQYYKTPLNYSKSLITDEYRELIMSTRDPSIRVVFPMGIVYWQNGILISFGKDDCISRLKFYSWKYILDLFQD